MRRAQDIPRADIIGMADRERDLSWLIVQQQYWSDGTRMRHPKAHKEPIEEYGPTQPVKKEEWYGMLDDYLTKMLPPVLDHSLGRSLMDWRADVLRTEGLVQETLIKKEKPKKEKEKKATRRAARPYKPVICIETGAIYPSRKDAAIAVDRSFWALCYAARAGTKCAGGHWAYVSELPQSPKHDNTPAYIPSRASEELQQE